MAVELHLRRVEQSRQTLGLLSVYRDGDRIWTCVTSEQAWRDNRNNHSCIPPGPGGGTVTYHVDHRDPPEWSAFPYPHLIVRGVEGRTAILFHVGNYVSDTEGCILVGRKFFDLNGDGVTDITSSGDTLEELLTYVPEEGADLHIRWVETPDIEQLMRQEDGPDLNELIEDANSFNEPR